MARRVIADHEADLTVPAVTGGSSDGETAILQVTGTTDGEKVEGEVTMKAWLPGPEDDPFSRVGFCPENNI